MGFLESLGSLAIIAGIIYLAIRYLDNKNASEQETNLLSSNNKKCGKLYRDYNNGKITHQELQNSVHKVLQDPTERQEALDKIKLKKEIESKNKEEIRQKRKIGYKLFIPDKLTPHSG
jgi:hypothetical protein